jgi:hypothetical protein
MNLIQPGIKISQCNHQFIGVLYTNVVIQEEEHLRDYLVCRGAMCVKCGQSIQIKSGEPLPKEDKPV